MTEQPTERLARIKRQHPLWRGTTGPRTAGRLPECPPAVHGLGVEDPCVSAARRLLADIQPPARVSKHELRRMLSRYQRLLSLVIEC
jgi:predicted metal-binding protein